MLPLALCTPRSSRPHPPLRLLPAALQLKSERDLDKVKGLKLEELWLDGNPLCDAFRDQATYVRSVLALGRP